mgnify:CR=1 FL=1
MSVLCVMHSVLLVLLSFLCVCVCVLCCCCFVFFFQAEDGIRDLVRSRGLGDVYKRQMYYSLVGCASGSCAITSSPVNSSLYGALMGGLLANSFAQKQPKAQD